MEATIANAVRLGAHELSGEPDDYGPLVERVGDAGCVLLGEATHGTREFYAERARITCRLIVVTSAVAPLEPDRGWSGGEPPETFPTGM